MMKRADERLESEQSFEELLGRATPRPMPSEEDTALVREAVHAEWQAVTRDATRRRRFVSLAAAATVLVALALVVNTARLPLMPAVQVAAIDRSVGSVYVLGEQSQLLAMPTNASITTDQTIVTANGSGLGLAWGTGGSLRIGEDSRVTFISDEVVQLASGRIYFDSEGMPPEATLSILTEHGIVTHLGTQYMVGVEPDTIEVSVREGKVLIDGFYHKAEAEEGEMVTMTGSARPAVLNISGYGDDWAWIEVVAPVRSWNGHKLLDLIEWVAHETGLSFEIVGTSVVELVNDEVLRGDFDDDPRTALRQGLRTFDLVHRIEDGVIYISEGAR